MLKRLSRVVRRLRIVPMAGAVLFAGTLGAPLHASHGSDMNLTISTDDDAPIERCDQVRVQFGGSRHPLPSARAERAFTLKRSETPVLEMHLEASGGMALSGWDGDDYAVTACLAAAGETDERARKALETIDVGFDGGRLSVRGADASGRLVYLLVKVPDRASLDLRSENGSIDLRDISGRIHARTHNGPLAVNDCSGDIDVAAENGPLSLRAGSGRQRASVLNGPLSIELQGSRWDGDGIEAEAGNGPLSLKIPERYESGVSLNMSGNAPIHCTAGCEEVWRPGGGARSLLFGSTRPVIRITSGNGPVDIDSGIRARASRSI
jgi:hypothetical protein